MKKFLFGLLLFTSIQCFGQWNKVDHVSNITPALPQNKTYVLSANSLTRLQEGDATWTELESGGASLGYDNFVAIFYGTDMFVLDAFEDYSVGAISNDDTGVYIFPIVGYDYGTQDDYTWFSASPGHGEPSMLHQFGPIDNMSGDDSVILSVFDEDGSPTNISGYYYIEIRIYPTP